MSGAALKQAIDRLIADEAVGAARARLAELWRQEPDVSVAGFVVSRYGRLGNRARLVSSRVAILRSFTVEPAMPLLRAAALVDGIDLNVQVGGFNTYAQEILDPGSGLYTFAPAV